MAAMTEQRSFDHLYLDADEQKVRAGGKTSTAATEAPFVKFDRYLVGGNLIKWNGPSATSHSPIFQRATDKPIQIGSFLIN